jgi:tetratricopeptide (TPR) repeat protein
MRISMIQRGFCLFALICMASSWGCIAKNGQQKSFQEYRKIIERQKAAAALEEDPVKKIPEMKAGEFERLGDSYLRRWNIDLAFIHYDKALRLEPSQIRVRYKMGRLFIDKGLTEEAKKEFREILKVNSNYALAYEGMGRVMFNTGHFEEAEKNFQQALELDPSLWQAHNFLGIIYDRQGQFESAIVQYKTAITLQPNQGLLFNNLGISLFLSREYDKAIRAFLEALRIENSDQKIYNNLALALCKLERYREGLEAFKKAGDEASAHYNLGCVYMVAGKYKEAIESFEKAIQIKPVFYVKAHENLRRVKEAVDASSRQ